MGKLKKKAKRVVGIAQYSDDIRRLRLAGTTLAGIADWLRTTHDMPVTRERVRQVLTKLLSTDEHQAVLEAAKAPTSCSVCGREGKTKNGLCSAHYDRRQKGADMDAPIRESSHKPSKCLGCGKKIGPGTGRVRNRQRCPRCYSKWAYYNLPGRREALNAKSNAWTKNKYRTDPAFKARIRAYQREWHRKRALAEKRERRAPAKALPKKARR